MPLWRAHPHILTPSQLLLFFSPLLLPAFFKSLKTVKDIQANKSTGNLPVLPFISLFTNCIVWTTYGLLAQDMTVIAPNVSGILFGAYYTSVYAKYHPTSLAKYYLGSAAILGGAGAMVALLPAAQAQANIGLLGCTLAVILMSSPLATLATVIRDKSTASMPFIMSFVRVFL
jgi:solute carrier family 50 protein (sugar transporter)